MKFPSFLFSSIVVLLSAQGSQAKDPLGEVTLVNHVGREVHVALVGAAGAGPQVVIPTGGNLRYRFKPKIVDPGGIIGFVVNDEAWGHGAALVISRCSARLMEVLRVRDNQGKMNRFTGGNMRITFRPEPDGSVSCDVEDNF